jgi:hypothetical protein
MLQCWVWLTGRVASKAPSVLLCATAADSYTTLRTHCCIQLLGSCPAAFPACLGLTNPVLLPLLGSSCVCTAQALHRHHCKIA